MTSSKWRGEAPKIVQIETRYVETDAINFRNVVQSLTGKNSSTAWIGRENAASSSVDAAAGSEVKGRTAHVGGVTGTAKTEEAGAASNGGNDQSLIAAMLMKNVSFRDFDRLLSELAPLEGMPWLYTEQK